jgi:hypothetical protein
MEGYKMETAGFIHVIASPARPLPLPQVFDEQVFSTKKAKLAVSMR